MSDAGLQAFKEAAGLEHPPVTYDDYRRGFDRLADHVGQWQGMPVPVEDIPLVLAKGHPYEAAYRHIDGIDGVEVQLVVGGPDDDGDDDERVVNHWVNRRHGYEVFVFRKMRTGRTFGVKVPLAPDSSMPRLTLWLTTLGASDAWDMAAERKARHKLCTMLSDRQWRHYDLTGAFLERSPRSDITYVFRRLRPTVALTPRWKEGSTQENMRCLAVLCMHPVGYYDRTWAGCMVPTDDVIAHLLWMRGDEADYWAKANQHNPATPEAGL